MRSSITGPTQETRMIQLKDLLQATGGTLKNGTGATEFTGFAFDSRQLEAGQLFLAVKTATGDGHDYISAAIERGAAGVLCDNDEAVPPNSQTVTTVVVSDVQEALNNYASYILL